jgi:predicted GIY-YIG superfamily endonuclease
MAWFSKRPKAGWVYGGESTRPDGSKQVYTGMTRRSLWTRWGEHMKGRGGKWTGRGSWFRPLGAVWSTNPRKAEKTLKRMSPFKKRVFWGWAAKRYHDKTK